MPQCCLLSLVFGLLLLKLSSAGDVVLDVDWPSFLSRHDMMWRWRWAEGARATLQLVATDLEHCGEAGANGACCVTFLGGTVVALELCSQDSPAQQWMLHSDGTVASVAASACLTVLNVTAELSPIIAADCATALAWVEYEGYWMPKSRNGTIKATLDGHKRSMVRVGDGPDPDGRCISVGVGSPFCNGTICPIGQARNFTAGLLLFSLPCTNGDRSQLIAAFSVPSAAEPVASMNLMPLTWAVAAYTGNGLVGVRVQCESGSIGVLHLLIDNVRLGAGAMRKPNGYFRFKVADPMNAPLTVSVRTTLADSVITANVTNTAGNVVANFTLFVVADLVMPAVVLLCDVPVNVSVPTLEWVNVGQADFSWHNFTHDVIHPTSAGAAGRSFRLQAIASVQAPDAAMDSAAVITAALAAGAEALLARTAAWWAAYWPQSFIALPITRVEGFYYVQMFRFPASDRVGLHGLMGAFGPTGNYNLWPDDVWDMNEQVMYWLSAASNRPEIAAGLSQWLEVTGGNDLWMLHNYVKQMQFEGNSTALAGDAFRAVVSAVRAVAGGSKSFPGKLSLINQTYHIVPCESPEYHCYPPFESRACSPNMDCNYELAQLRWGLQTALALGDADSLATMHVDAAWWRSLLDSELAWYPWDHATGFRLDADCSFECPHRHFSHLLQIYDLETVSFGSDGRVPLSDAPVERGPIGNRPTGQALDALILQSLDQWYGVTCNSSNWFNEECRGFTRCGVAAMSSVVGRAASAQGNLTELIDSLVTPNGMYGEMVYMSHPNEFSPVAESAYCGAGVLHTMLLHTDSITGVLSIFPGLAEGWPSASFHMLRASGGLLVSALREDSLTRFVRVWSRAGGRVLLRVPHDAAWASATPAVDPPSIAVSAFGGGVWEVTLAPNSSVVVYAAAAGVRSPFVIRPLPSNPAEEHWFGYSRPVPPLH